MAKKFNKEDLFENYFNTAKDVFINFELVFEVEGVCEQLFGAHPDHDFNDEAAKQRVRSSEAWQSLSHLYDYAVDGIRHDAKEPEEIVLAGAEVISYVTTENQGPAEEWDQIVAQGDGRFGLDNGSDLSLEKLALLADVDERTVRNAISHGDLVAHKDDGILFIGNTSARNWLSGRRGFKPSRIPTDLGGDISQISTPIEFGAFLLAQRKTLGLDTIGNKVVMLHPSVDLKTIMDIEKGVFKLPLDTVFPLADFYQIDRKGFLDAVMRIFFAEQLRSLQDVSNEK